jgi:hypothetical protein
MSTVYAAAAAMMLHAAKRIRYRLPSSLADSGEWQFAIVQEETSS